MLRRILLDEEEEEEEDSVSLTCPPAPAPPAAATAENGRPLRNLGRWAFIRMR